MIGLDPIKALEPIPDSESIPLWNRFQELIELESELESSKSEKCCSSGTGIDSAHGIITSLKRMTLISGTVEFCC